MKKILFICPYPLDIAPSQRFRFEQYFNHLEKRGFSLEIKPFFTEKAYLAAYHSGKSLTIIHAIVLSYFKRIKLLLHLSQFDFVFIHRECAPIGPPFIEFIIARVLRKKVIYDFDDAIWLTDKTHESLANKIIRWRKKVGTICKWSHKVSCGNQYLAQYARKFNSHIVINPTTIDTNNLHRPKENTGSKETITLGWTGSRSTLKYLKAIVSPLQSLQSKYPQLEIIVIADEDPKLPLPNVQFIPWRKESEITDLARFDIGLMPLPDDDWTRGKCGFKALQYMSMCIPALVSPVGVNREIVTDGVDGFWCYSSEDWFRNVEDLILHREKVRLMGLRGRKKVIEYYSSDSNAPTFLSLFQ